MNKILLLLVVLIPQFSFSQRVGLVLSGGAAKGIAHIGVLKALEENEIPIDYIVGTSMGAVVGGAYAAGHSPKELEEIVLSDQFLRWIKGSTSQDQNYYYHQDPLHPGFVKINLALDSTFNLQFNSTIANDLQLNFVLAELTAQATQAAKGNFDSLFVPIRVMTADIFTQQEVVLRKGNLGDAIRASQSVPFFYSPTKIDGKYLFDGGVYNNFPADVMKTEFCPDVTIGVNVSARLSAEYPYGQDEELISHSLIYLLIDKSSPAKLSDEDVYIQPDISPYTSFDFKFARSLIDSGYVQTMRMMPEIKAKVKARIAQERVDSIRTKFREGLQPLNYASITVDGYTKSQSKYMGKVVGFRQRSDRSISHADVRRGYQRLISEQYFSSVYPSITYDSADKDFRFTLSKRHQKNFNLDFGGVLASRDISTIFLGLNYYRFNQTLTHAQLNLQRGSFHREIELSARVDMPYRHQLYFRPYVSDNSWNFLEVEDLIQTASTPTILKRNNTRGGVDIGLPMGSQFKLVAKFESFRNKDQFTNTDVYISTDTLDLLRLNGFKTGLAITANSLDRKQYPRAGRRFYLGGYYFRTKSEHIPGTTSEMVNRTENVYNWLQLRVRAEQYFNRGSIYRPGYILEGLVSNQPTFQNYRATLINTPAFEPIQDSPALLLENFRSCDYLAAGIRNVFVLHRNLDFRLEGYVFKPLTYLAENSNQEAITNSDLTKVYLAATAQLVHHSPVGPIAASLNYYDDKENQLGLFLHVGYLLFNDHSLH